MDVPDIAAIAQVAKGAGIPLFVDSTMTTPCLVRPGELGAGLFPHFASFADRFGPLAIHPASTIFCEFSPGERAMLGVTDDMVRLSVGIEAAEDLMEDIGEALEGIGQEEMR
ncbi:MAG TPA: PLP-dependent transferase [Nitrospirota bacterium]|nr:PLP-dependent transferase [Nitrospirota bacterium]